MPATDEFAVLTDSRWRWPLRTDVEQVVRKWCGRPKAELTAKEWELEFPGIERVPVC